MEHTQGEVNHVDGQVSKPSVLDDHLGQYHINGCRPVLCQRGDRTACIHASASGGQRHRPSHVVEEAPTRFPTIVPHGQVVPDCVCQLCVS